MRWLCTPYLTKVTLSLFSLPQLSSFQETEKEYIDKHGTFLEAKRREAEHKAFSKMPGKPKAFDVHGNAIAATANYGNLLHKSRTIEDSLRMLINKNRWD